MQSGLSTPFAWRSAPQPDIVRAAQKDDLYLQQSIDACHDAVMRLFGAIPALQHSKSCRMVATFMYYALTTGAGLQTLGEEYCDILQLHGQRMQLPAITSQQTAQQQMQLNTPVNYQQQQPAHQMVYGLPAARTRVLLVLLQSLGAPLVGRLVSSLDRAVESGSVPSDYGGYSSSGVGDELSYTYEDDYQDSDSGSRTAGAHQHSSSRTPTVFQHLQQRWQQLAQWLAPRWPDIKTWLLFAGRLHLAAFYLNGVYYEWSKRLVGITYSSVSANKDQRASYRVLGYMLVVQLAVSAAMQARPQLSAFRQSISSKQLQQHARSQQQHAVMLPDDYDVSAGISGSSWPHPDTQQQQQQQEDSASGGRYRIGSGKQCPLCLSSRANPTCTPCGHVFCWHCIAQWCTEKPECPLCRTAVIPSQLVCVYHSDF